MSPDSIPSTRDALRKAVPALYLARGWRDHAGHAFLEIHGWWATAAAEQLLASRVAVQEVQTTLEAFQQILPYYGDRAAAELPAVASEALDLVQNLLGQPNNPGFVAWLEPCVLSVRDAADLAAFLAHFRAVSLQYAAVARSAPPERG
ncbi:hypothetical protein HL658_08090 [Azospirillum sp. RWY-5-1]|uniref:Uncharacterized protein n=1 Tax=Azospirillum oleiclasticum TaxID=2735135 RepID=A0ABX2T5S8_9PROT|nr:hypothetical protein [Azospirillum oleiclasticum]NYZ12507.1 hypothetical protein [Azospirillum oleiclasticum]NYZ19667.1 hypothetical protein [Azospirillum oleiclasticum]